MHLWLRAVRDTVEYGHAVSFRPETDLAGVGKGPVFNLKGGLAVEDDLETASRKLHAQLVPLTGRTGNFTP